MLPETANKEPTGAALLKHLMQGIHEGALIVLGAVSLYLALALYNYHPEDPGFLKPGVEGQQVQNLAGPIGAWIADLLLKMLGYAAHAAPVLIAALTVQFYLYGRSGKAIFWYLVALRGCGILLIMLSSTLFAVLVTPFVEFATSLPEGAGGIAGQALYAWLDPGVDVVGTVLVATIIAMVGARLAGWVSWLRLAEWIIRLLSRALSALLSVLVYLAAASWHGFFWLAGRVRTVASRAVRRSSTNAQLVGGGAATSGNEGLLSGGVAGNANVAGPHSTAPADTARPLSAGGFGSGEAAATSTAAGGAVSTGAAGGNRGVSADVGQTRGEVSPSVAQKNKTRPPKNKTKPPSVARARRVASALLDSEQSAHADTTEKTAPLDSYTRPGIALLDAISADERRSASEASLESMASLLESRLKDFGVSAEVMDVHPGPVITRFEIQPASGVKVSRITALAKDMARSMAVTSVRVVEVIPGKTVVGIEIPNEHREVVRLSEILDSKVYVSSHSVATMALGKSISGEAVVVDLAKMPHLLVAGTTGSGKSVGLNAMLLSLLFKASPADLRLILVDPKMLELSVYEGIPHLLAPVIVDMKEAANALRWCVAEMERRYRLMSTQGVRNLNGYNKKVLDAKNADEPIRDPLWPEDSSTDAPFLDKLPLIVVVIDEFADMMMMVGKKVEELIARIAQKARAAGVHLILATQRPSVDVITGLIKANIPARISFLVSSKIDSRTILGQGGGEQLLGHGDMLYLPPGTAIPVRVHGAFVGDQEVHRVAQELRGASEPDYVSEVLHGDAGPDTRDGRAPYKEDGDNEDSDALFDQAVACVLESRRATISYVQRKLRIGYNRSARLIEAMESAGVISPPDASGNREVLRPAPDDA